MCRLQITDKKPVNLEGSDSLTDCGEYKIASCAHNEAGGDFAQTLI